MAEHPVPRVDDGRGHANPLALAAAPATAALLAGDLYVNLHTQAFPGGEVRGQLRRVARQVSEPAPVLLVATAVIALWAFAFRRVRRISGG